MKELSGQALAALLEGSATIEEDAFGIKVARLGDGTFLKIYRRKRLLSSSLWQPPAERFARNAERLNALGIHAPGIVETFNIPERLLNGVLYSPLPGETLRNLWKQTSSQDRAHEVEAFGKFLGELHGLGVYFRSLHLGNVLKLPDGRFGLIDLSDMRISGRPLPGWKRKRNVRHMLRYQLDAQWLAILHLEELLRGYSSSAGESATKALRSAISALRPIPPQGASNTP